MGNFDLPLGDHFRLPYESLVSYLRDCLTDSLRDSLIGIFVYITSYQHC